MSMMMMGFAMKMAAIIPIAVGVLFLLAGKALIISKIALVLTLVIALKKLLSQKQGKTQLRLHIAIRPSKGLFSGSYCSNIIFKNEILQRIRVALT